MCFPGRFIVEEACPVAVIVLGYRFGMSTAAGHKTSDWATRRGCKIAETDIDAPTHLVGGIGYTAVRRLLVIQQRSAQIDRTAYHVAG